MKKKRITVIPSTKVLSLQATVDCGLLLIPLACQLASSVGQTSFVCLSNQPFANSLLWPDVCKAQDISSRVSGCFPTELSFPTVFVNRVCIVPYISIMAILGQTHPSNSASLLFNGILSPLHSLAIVRGGATWQALVPSTCN